MAPLDPRLTISLLGPVQARADSTDLALGGRRQRAVLARLALARGEVVSTERMVDDLWLGEPPPSATNTLQSYVSNLRRVLGADVEGRSSIERVGDGYRLAVEPGTLLTETFERLLDHSRRPGAPVAERLAELDAALALWHGPAIADFVDEPWAQGDATRLDDLRLAAIEDRFEALLQLGRHAAIVGDLDVASAQHPLRERLTSQLVVALYRCGRHAEALRAYERTRSYLGDELGLDPSPELAELARRVLAHDPALLGESLTGASSTPTHGATHGAGTVADAMSDPFALQLPPAVSERRARSPFVGRSEQLAVLESAWATVHDGDRRLVALAGEPGMGKTRLAQRFARWVYEQGGRVMWGRCTAENLIAYQPAVEAMRTALRDLSADAVDQLIAGRSSLGWLAPDGTPDAAGTPTRAERYGLHEALVDCFATLSAAAPVLLVVDDVQWADPSAIGLIEHLLRADRTGRLLVVATVRRPAGRATPELDRALTDLRRDGRLDLVPVEGLDTQQVSELLSTQGVDVGDEAAESVHERTGGNPFFVESLAAAGGDLRRADARSLPDSVRDLLDQQLAALDPAAARVMGAAAVIGQRVELDVLGEVAGLDPVALLDVVDPAVAAGLLVEDEELGRVAFPHALVRQGLIANTTRNREAQLHLRVADVLEARPPADDHQTTVASHLLAAGPACPPRRAAAAAIAAGRAALAMLADAEARTWAQRAAARLGPEPSSADADADDDLRAEADLLISAASRNLADLDIAEAAIDRLVDLARRTGDGLLLARAAQEAAQLDAGIGFSFGAVDDTLVARLEEALATLGAEHVAERSMLLAWLSIAITGADDLPRQQDLSIQARALAAEVPERDDVAALAAYARRVVQAGPDGLEERRTLGPAMLTSARRAGWIELEVIGLLFSCVDLLEDDRLVESHAVLDELRVRLSQGDRAMFDVYVHFLDGAFALLAGDLDAAEQHSATALAIGEAAHGGNATQGWAAQQFLLGALRGDVAGFAPLVADLAEQYPTMPVWQAALAWCAVNAGDVDGARAAARSAFVDDQLPLRQSATWYTAVAQLAEVAFSTGDAELATLLLPLVEPIAERVAITGMGVICLGHLSRSLGQVLAASGRTDEAIEALTEAVVRSRACGFLPFLARALAERATLLERRDGPGDRDAARRDRTEAAALAAEVGIRLSLLPDRT
jgi:DNA-binding SARP family transcriptional activator